MSEGERKQEQIREQCALSSLSSSTVHQYGDLSLSLSLSLTHTKQNCGGGGSFNLLTATAKREALRPRDTQSLLRTHVFCICCSCGCCGCCCCCGTSHKKKRRKRARKERKERNGGRKCREEGVHRSGALNISLQSSASPPPALH